MRWRREARLPDDARAALGLQRRERVLAAASDGDHGWVAATGRALVGPGWRIEWSDVAHARWLGDESVLVLDPVPGTFPPRRVPLARPGRLPETVRERVMASIVVSRRVAVPGGWTRLVGRLGAAGQVAWQVVPEPGVDTDHPDVRRVLDAALCDLRAEVGET